MRVPHLVRSLPLAFLPIAVSYQVPLKQWLADNAIAWAASRGLQIASAADEKNPGATRFVHLPISLLPLPFPRAALDEAIEVAPVFNLLVDRVSRDDEWLKSTLSEVSAAPLTHGRYRASTKVQRRSAVSWATSWCPMLKEGLSLHTNVYLLQSFRRRVMTMTLCCLSLLLVVQGAGQ
jgi:hypothetical protein